MTEYNAQFVTNLSGREEIELLNVLSAVVNTIIRVYRLG
ncbi:hypothetical protein ES705_05271 [subsurface metagenome]